MNYKYFIKEAREWGVSNHFINRMRLAMTGSGERVAKLNPNHVTKTDMRFLANFGYTYNTNDNTVEV